MTQAQSGSAWGEPGDGSTEQGGFGRVMISPAAVITAVGLLFVVAGLTVFLSNGRAGPLTSLFDGFMYVGLPTAVIVGGLGLRRSDLPARSQWFIVSGYAAGIGVVTGLLLWSELAYLFDGGTLLALRDDFLFYGNVGGVLGFVAGTNRARAANDRRLRRELERQNETLDEFASAISHDLRSPLQVANGRVVLARRECDCDEHLREAKHALDRMETLIEESLVLARQGERVVESRELGLAPLVDSCWRSVDTGDLDLVVDVADGVTIRADEVRAAQIFENLFRNAVEHGSTSPPSHDPGDAAEHRGAGGTVRVGTLPDGFFVADEGPGIPPEKREQVFEAGYTTTEDGTGYGLRIVRAIVEAHDWEVDVTESDAGGARFEITGVDVDR